MMSYLPVQDVVQPEVAQKKSRMRSVFGRDRKAQVGLFILGFFVLIAVFAPLIAPFDPNEMSLNMMDNPSGTHWLGTDDLGRDLLSRVIWGTQISLFVGVSTVTLALVAGVTLGVLAGYYGGWIDDTISRVIDTFMAIPFIVLAMSVIAVLGTQGGNSILILVIVLGATGWVTFARVVRGEVMGVKALEYVEAARALGQRHFWIVGTCSRTSRRRSSCSGR